MANQKKQADTAAKKAAAPAKKESKPQPVYCTIDGQKFEITKPKILFKGKRYTAQEAAKNKELLAQLKTSTFKGFKKA